MKNLTRKLLTVLMAVALVFTSVNTVKADPNSTDTGTLSVSGLKAQGDEVTFYQIAKIEYEGNDLKLIDDWTFANTGTYKVTADQIKNLANNSNSADFEGIINEWAQKIESGELVPNKSYVSDKEEKLGTDENPNFKAYKEGCEPGVYVAVVTDKGDDARIYNPVLLALVYENGSLPLNDSEEAEATISFVSDYRNGGVAKSSNPGSGKAIVGGTTQDDTLTVDGTDEDDDWENKHNLTAGADSDFDKDKGAKTASKDEVVDYAVKIDVPVYPDNAINKSMWAQDILPYGVVYKADSLKVDGASLEHPTAEEVAANNADEDQRIVFTTDSWVAKKNGKIIAVVQLNEQNDTKKVGGGWQMAFDYDNLTAGGTFLITYSATVTDKAKIGQVGNDNKVTYLYSNNPSKGDQHKTPDEPDDDERKGMDKDEDYERLYTYTVAIVKVDKDDVTKRLTGAKFEVWYSEEELNIENGAFKAEKAKAEAKPAQESKVERIKTETEVNADGTLELDHVKFGYYYFVETKAADGGYAINKDDVSNVTMVKACYADSVYEKSTHTVVEYTAKKEEALGYNAETNPNPEVVVYLGEKGEVLSVEEYEALEDTAKTYYKPGYKKSEKTQTVVDYRNLDTTPEATGISRDIVKNTRQPGLPSTGGVGTYIFTIAGVAILATAAFMLIFRKREDA